VSNHRFTKVALAATTALLCLYKIFVIPLATVVHDVFGMPVAFFCVNFFAVGRIFSRESCALPMTMYAYLSLAVLVPSIAWWTYASTARFRR
jgi:hypothetical protein